MPVLAQTLVSPLRVQTTSISPILTDMKMSPSAADKRRNKLGYHRTSVACGHCRRRKIRCLLAPEDAHGRCSNCIRLKKDCNFYPVDQQPPNENKPRKSDSNSQDLSNSSTATSPHTLAPGLEDGEPAFPHYSQLPISSGEYSYGQFGETAPSPLTSVPATSGFEPPRYWSSDNFMDSPFADHAKSESTDGYWHGDRMMSDFSNTQYTPMQTARVQQSRTATGSVISFQDPKREGPWVVPATRSLSMANITDFQHLDQASQQNQRRMTASSGIYTPSLYHSSTSSNASISESQPASVSAFSTQAMTSPVYPAQWNALASQGGIMGKTHDSMGNTWFGDSMPQLGQLPEEESQYPDHFHNMYQSIGGHGFN